MTVLIARGDARGECATFRMSGLIHGDVVGQIDRGLVGRLWFTAIGPPAVRTTPPLSRR